VWDLGEEWCRWTGLPFVFAVWAARRDVPESTLRRVEPLLSAARDSGRANFASIAAAEATSHRLTVAQCLGYLRDNLHYDLGIRERMALARFHDLAAALSLAPKGLDIDRALALPGAPKSH
jgi:chorismate dehydratase